MFLQKANLYKPREFRFKVFGYLAVALFLVLLLFYCYSYASVSAFNNATIVGQGEVNNISEAKELELSLSDKSSAIVQPQTLEITTNNTTDETIFKLLSDISALQQEVYELRGLVELYSFKLKKFEALNSSYLEGIDRKLASLESRDFKTKPSSDSVFALKENDFSKDVPNNSVNIGLQNDEDALYKKAYKLLQENNYGQATNAFTEFLATYPSSSNVANARYWLGELYLNDKKSAQAQTEFTTIIENYPQHDKAAEALLKLGILKSRLGEYNLARNLFTKLGNDYPQSHAARLAEVRLRQLAVA